MCGRFGRYHAADVFAKIIDAEVSDRLDDDARYNRPPGTFQAVALLNPDSGAVTLGPAWWGFIPNWAKDTQLSPINARSETAPTNKLFGKAFEHQRCLVPADYWIEWQKQGEAKQPYAIRPKDEQPFFFAGLWSKAARLPDDHPAAGQVTFAILTGTPSADIEHIHNRQPQAMTADGARQWLDPDLDVDQAREVLEKERYANYEAWPIAKKIGNPANEGPDLIEPISG
ncbi:SOS response-associated peptidase [Salinisphaera hydrothermalis]|uniref:SOS response-associated peptidase n=1 Tax=Salinisphaera hydrothermalis TaxID=563188 RepID=UPI003340B7AB